MGRNLLLSAICAVSFSLGLFGALSEAAATPFTYEFKLPSWTFNSAPTVFGASAVFDVTVNNGGSSGTSQSFAFSDIQSVSVTAVGGSCSPCFSDTWPGAALSGVSVPNTVFLLTDPSGVPTLDLSLQAGDTNFVSYTNAWTADSLFSTAASLAYLVTSRPRLIYRMELTAPVFMILRSAP